MSSHKKAIADLTFILLFWILLFTFIFAIRYFDSGDSGFHQLKHKIYPVRIFGNGVLMGTIVGICFALMETVIKNRGIYKYSLFRIILNRTWIQFIISSLVLTVIALGALILVRDASSPWLLYVYAFCFGYGSGLYSPTIFAGAADIFHGEQFGSINGIILTGMGIGGAIGPWIGGYIYDVWGSYDYAIILSMVCFALSGITFVLAAPRKALLIRQKL